jgi:hypothetical protein
VSLSIFSQPTLSESLENRALPSLGKHPIFFSSIKSSVRVDCIHAPLVLGLNPRKITSPFVDFEPLTFATLQGGFTEPATADAAPDTALSFQLPSNVDDWSLLFMDSSSPTRRDFLGAAAVVPEELAPPPTQHQHPSTSLPWPHPSASFMMRPSPFAKLQASDLSALLSSAASELHPTTVFSGTDESASEHQFLELASASWSPTSQQSDPPPPPPPTSSSSSSSSSSYRPSRVAAHNHTNDEASSNETEQPHATAIEEAPLPPRGEVPERAVSLSPESPLQPCALPAVLTVEVVLASEAILTLHPDRFKDVMASLMKQNTSKADMTRIKKERRKHFNRQYQQRFRDRNRANLAASDRDESPPAPTQSRKRASNGPGPGSGKSKSKASAYARPSPAGATANGAESQPKSKRANVAARPYPSPPSTHHFAHQPPHHAASRSDQHHHHQDQLHAHMDAAAAVCGSLFSCELPAERDLGLATEPGAGAMQSQASLDGDGDGDGDSDGDANQFDLLSGLDLQSYMCTSLHSGAGTWLPAANHAMFVPSPSTLVPDPVLDAHTRTADPIDHVRAIAAQLLLGPAPDVAGFMQHLALLKGDHSLP